MPNIYELSEQLDKVISSITEANLEKNLLKIQELMSAGADPLLPLNENDGSQSETLVNAMFIGNFRVLSTILSHSRKIGKPIDLSYAFKAKTKGVRGYNIFTAACRISSLEIVNLMYKHGLETQQDLFKIANEKVQFKSTLKELHACMVEILPCAIDVFTLLDNCNVDQTAYSNKQEYLDAKKYLRQWEFFHGEKAEPVYDGPIRLTFSGRLDILHFLIKHNLIDFNELTASGHPIDVFVKALATVIDLQDWFKKMKFFVQGYSGYKLERTDMEANPSKENTIILKMKIRNKCGLLEREFEVIFDLNEYNKVIQKTVADLEEAKKHGAPQIAELKQQLTEQNARITQTHQLATETRQIVDELPQVTFTNTRKTYEADEQALECFDKVYHEVSSHLKTFKLATTGMANIKSTDTMTDVAKLAVSALNAVAQNTVPGATAVPFILNGLLDLRTKRNTAAQAGGVVAATAGLSTKAIATAVAGLIAAEYQKRNVSNEHGKLPQKLAALVTSQIKSLHNLGAENMPANEYELVGFLCATAVNKLQPKQKLDKSDSSGSNTTPTDSNSSGGVAAIKDLPSSGKRNDNNGNCCNIS